MPDFVSFDFLGKAVAFARKDSSDKVVLELFLKAHAARWLHGFEQWAREVECVCSKRAQHDG